MDKSTNQVIEALQALSKRPVQHFYPRDNREDGAVWPAHKPDDLPDTSWYVIDPS